MALYRGNEKILAELKIEAERKLKSPRGSILEDALHIINGERTDAHGKPENCFPLIAELWTTYLSSKGKLNRETASFISAADVCFLMHLLKIARIISGSAVEDSVADAAGYLGLYWDFIKGGEPQTVPLHPGEEDDEDSP